MTKMIAPERCFQIYLSVKAHFTSEKYDAIKYNGRIKNASSEQFEKRPDRGLFTSISKKFDSVQHAASFFVANLAYGKDYPLDDEEVSLRHYTRWQRNRQSLTKMFRDDLSTISAQNRSYADMVKTDGEVPYLFLLYKNGTVNIETLTIMNKLENFSDEWNKVLHIWKSDVLRIRKLDSFIKFDEAKFSTIYNQFKDTLVQS